MTLDGVHPLIGRHAPEHAMQSVAAQLSDGFRRHGAKSLFQSAVQPSLRSVDVQLDVVRGASSGDDVRTAVTGQIVDDQIFRGHAAFIEHVFRPFGAAVVGNISSSWGL